MSTTSSTGSTRTPTFVPSASSTTSTPSRSTACTARPTSRPSTGATASPPSRCTLTGLALVGQTAGVGARPVRAFDGDFRYRRQSRWPSILDRAGKAVGTECRWSRPAALTIHRPTDAELRIAAGLAPLEAPYTAAPDPLHRRRSRPRDAFRLDSRRRRAPTHDRGARRPGRRGGDRHHRRPCRRRTVRPRLLRR